MADFAAERENVSHHHAAVVDDDVAFHGDEIAEQLAIDIRVTLHHEEMAGHLLGGAHGEIAEPGRPARNRHPDGSVGRLQGGPEPGLHLRGLAEITELDLLPGPGGRRDGLRGRTGLPALTG